MVISVDCGGCHRHIRVKDEYAGRRIRCPDCRATVTVPGGEAPDDFVFADREEEGRLPARRTRPLMSTGRMRKPDRVTGATPWYKKQWQWLAVLVMLLSALFPMGLIVSGLIAFAGMMLALVCGIIPIIRIIVGAPGTVLSMIVSRSARFDMMRQPDSHPYKQLVRTAMGPARGLFWRGVLLMVVFIPVAKIHGAANDWWRNRGHNVAMPEPESIAMPGAPGFTGVVDFRSPEHSEESVNGPIGGGSGSLPMWPQQNQPLPSPDRVSYVTMTWSQLPERDDIPKFIEDLLASFDGYIAGSVLLDIEARSMQFRFTGTPDPTPFGQLFSRSGFGRCGVRISANP